MVKYRSAGEHAAYEIAEGVFDQDEAAKLGLAVVERDGYGNATAYGRYKGAPDGGPLGVTVPESEGTKVIAGGDVGPGSPPAAGGKGDIVNVNDPFVHGGTGDESIHADNSEPPVQDLNADRREAVKVAEKSIEDAGKSHGKKK